MSQSLLEQMKMKRSVQQNIPYGSGQLAGKALFRSGDIRRTPTPKVGGFNPLLLAPFIPIFHEIIKRPINKLYDKIGLGNGGAIFRSGGSFQKSADIGLYTRPVNSEIHIPPAHSMNNAAFGGGNSVRVDGGAKLSKYEQKNLRILESKLGALAASPEAFVSKLQAIHAKGEAWFRKHRKAAKYNKTDKPKYKFSKRYKALKVKYYAKNPKSGGKYHKSVKYKKHKLAYLEHRKKKAKC